MLRSTVKCAQLKREGVTQGHTRVHQEAAREQVVTGTAQKCLFSTNMWCLILGSPRMDSVLTSDICVLMYVQVDTYVT